MSITNILDYLKYIYVLVLYVICFVYMFKGKTEYISFIILISLNIFSLLFVFTLKGTGSKLTLIPFHILLWDGTIPLKIIYIISWFLLLVANAILINTYRLLHSKYSIVGKSVDLGDPKNYRIKDGLKTTIILNIIFLWILFISITLIDNISFYNKETNIFKLFVSIGSLSLSSINIYQSKTLANNTKIITTPSS